MRTLFLCLLLAFAPVQVVTLKAATSFTEWYCNSTGTNINAGSTTNAVPVVSGANGNWDSATGIYICSGATDLSGVSVGDWASVFNDGATTAVFIGRITAVVDATDTITVSLTIKTGTAPSTSATGRSIRVGGAWYGPWYTGGTVDTFPASLVNNLLTNTSQNIPRYNFKNDRTYFPTNLNILSNGPMRFEGHTLTPGDGGRTTFDGATAGAGSTVVTITGANIDFGNFLVSSNGASGSAGDGILANGTECLLFGCAARLMRRDGINVSALTYLVECEAYSNNVAPVASHGGFVFNSAASIAVRCISHHNTGVNGSGFVISANATLVNCISHDNGRDGYLISATTAAALIGCSGYNNASNHVQMTGASAALLYAENNNVLKNGTIGFNSAGSPLRNGAIVNTGYGAGTQANAGGNLGPIGGIQESGSISYANDTTPWVAPTTGNFSQASGAASINAGRGTFLQTAGSFSGTVSYPDIGATQITNSSSGSATLVMFGRR